MPKLIGIVLAVLVLWTVLEVYTEGTEGAFGGKLAALMGESNTSSADHTISAPRRAGEAVERAHQRQQDRYDDLLGD